MMNSKQKQKKFSRNISIVLAVLIVATLCVTIAALTASRRARSSEESSSTLSTAKTESTEQSAVAPPDSTENTEAPPAEATKEPVSDPAASVIEWSVPANGNIVKDYSADVPVFSLTMEDYRVHTGIDIEGDAGDDVFAAASGVIENVYYDPMMGQTVVIKHNDTYKTVYQNLQTIIPEGITVGAFVSGGQKIGSIGDTALIEISESPHLHFCITVDGKYANPLSYITVSASAGSSWYED